MRRIHRIPSSTARASCHGRPRRRRGRSRRGSNGSSTAHCSSVRSTARRLPVADAQSMWLPGSRASIYEIGSSLDDTPASQVRVASPILRAFLASPRTLHIKKDLCRAIGLSAGGLRSAVREGGFHRFEEMLTWLRSETWIWLVSAGVDRKLAEAYLGIADRSNFRRACKRASIEVPWQRRPDCAG